MLGVEYNNGEAVKSLFDSLVKKYSSVVRDDGGSGGAKRTSGSTGSFSSADMKPPKNTESGLNNDIFSDMANQEWAKEAVASLTRRGIVNGVSATEFNPDGNVTREQFTKMAVLADGIYDKNSSAEFTDADENAWYYSYISSARESNLITGRPDGSFGVGEYITKEDIAVIMMRIMVLNGKSPSDGECMISDISAVSDYAVDAVKMLNSYGIIKGDENARFEPKRYSTRAEAAFVIYSLLKECDVK